MIEWPLAKLWLARQEREIVYGKLIKNNTSHLDGELTKTKFPSNNRNPSENSLKKIKLRDPRTVKLVFEKG